MGGPAFPFAYLDRKNHNMVFLAAVIGYESLDEALEAVKCHYRDNVDRNATPKFNIYTSPEGHTLVEVEGNGPMHAITFYKILGGLRWAK